MPSNNLIISLLIIPLMLTTFGCKQEEKATTTFENTAERSGLQQPASLPSWNEGATKSAIVDFVTAATTPGHPGFIPENDRIATFDNDGTLWAEQPMYFQLLFAIDRIKEMAPEHPEWKTTEPYRSVLENNLEKLENMGLHAILELVMTTHADMSPMEFRGVVRNWLARSSHPTTGRPYTKMTYQPMLELLDYLRKNEFKPFIVSGGGIEFLRAWAEEVYGIPPYQVIGSSIKTTYTEEEGKPVIQRLPDLDFIDDKEGKPLGINRFIGKIPVIAVGNSDGDLQMLQYSATSPFSLQIYLHHTDSIREWAYDRNSHIGKLDKGLNEAVKNGWLVIDMATDWNRIFPD